MLTQAEVLEAIRRGSLPDATAFDPRSTALVTAGSACQALGPPGQGEVEVVSRTEDQVQLRTRASRPACLVVSQRFDRGWAAYVDGSRVPGERVDGILIGLSVPAGEHSVRLSFEPPAWRQGLAVTGTAVLVLACILAAPLRRRSD
jgi:uncharacterized membrane protein YfhO